MRIGFLLNHYTDHQVFHSVPIAFALSEIYRDCTVQIMASNPDFLDTARRLGSKYPGHSCQFIELKISPFARMVEKFAGQLFFVRKKSTIRSNIDFYKNLDVLVVPEKNSLTLKKIPELAHLKFVRIRHGAGDRETGLDQSNAQFDLVLASGQKMKDRLIKSGILQEGQCKIIGYPKFDLVTSNPQPKPIFENGNPIVIYNPHFKSRESSFVKWGYDVLDFFVQNTQYNLIFAPHIMLYKRGLQNGAKPLGRYKGLKNIHLDIGSPASVDMTYTRQADIYLGDVSSQVYEFLLVPRPCIFLNAHGACWQGKDVFANWTCGQVLDEIKNLPQALVNAQAKQAVYGPVQKTLFSYTFDLTEVPSATRAATAIYKKFK